MKTCGYSSVYSEPQILPAATKRIENGTGDVLNVARGHEDQVY